MPHVAVPRLRRTANELELALSAEAAHLLGSALRQPSADVATLVAGPPTPYAVWLSRILVRRHESGKVGLSIDEAASALVLEGERRYLDILAENVEVFIDEKPRPGDHLHIEYHDDHFYLAPSRISLAIVPDDNDARIDASNAVTFPGELVPIDDAADRIRRGHLRSSADSRLA